MKVERLKQSDVDKLKKRVPQFNPKRGRPILIARRKPLKKSTTFYHIIKFVQIVIDVLDKHGKNGFCIVIIIVRSIILLL